MGQFYALVVWLWHNLGKTREEKWQMETREETISTVSSERPLEHISLQPDARQ